MNNRNFFWLNAIVLLLLAGSLQAQNRGQSCEIEARSNIALNGKDIVLRNCADKNHGLGWYYGGKSFGTHSPDGPVLYGYRSGILGTTDRGRKGILFWNKDGNVGIGTEKPAANMHVAGTAKVTGEFELGKFNIPAGFTTELGRNEPLINMDINFRQEDKNTQFLGASFRMDSRPNDPLFNWIRRNPGSTSEEFLMVLWRDGRLGLGKRNPSCKLDVAGSICANGNPINSDERFKKDIEQLENSLSQLVQLEGVSYYMRTEEFKDRNFASGQQIGLIAQDVEKVYPELVMTMADGYKAVNYDGLIPVLIESLKEQQTIINQLEDKVSNMEALQAQLNTQQKQIAQLTALVSKNYTEQDTAVKNTEE